MSELTSAERVMRVLRNEEPDRIPHFEWIIDHKVREAICPGAQHGGIHRPHGAGRDPHRPRLQEGAGRPEPLSATNGAWCWRRPAEEHGFPVEGPIQTLDDLRKYEPPDPARPGPLREPEADGRTRTRASWPSAYT